MPKGKGGKKSKKKEEEVIVPQDKNEENAGLPTSSEGTQPAMDEGAMDNPIYEPLTPTPPMRDQSKEDEYVDSMLEGESVVTEVDKLDADKLLEDDNKTFESQVNIGETKNEEDVEMASINNLELSSLKGALEEENKEEETTLGSESNSEDDEAKSGKGEDLTRKYVVCQTEEKGVTVITVGPVSGDPGWPLVYIPDEIVKTAPRPLQLGDLVRVKSTNSRSREQNTIFSPAGKLNHHKVATEVEICRLKMATQYPAIVLDKICDSRTRKFKCLLVAAPDLPASQKIYQRQIGDVDFLNGLLAGSVVISDQVEIKNPGSVKMGNKGSYLLPADCPYEFGRESKRHEPMVAIKINPCPIKYTFPFNETLGKEEIKLGEQVIASAIAAAIDKIEEDLKAGTISARFTVLEQYGNVIIGCFEYRVHSKRALVDLTDVWVEDTPLKVKIDAAGTKNVAAGYVMETNKVKINEEAYILQAKVLLAYQEAKKYDAAADFDMIGCGNARILLQPQSSVATMMRRMTKFYGGGLADNPIGMILMGTKKREINEGEFGVDWNRLVEEFPSLIRLDGGQRDSAFFMLDPFPRVVWQQAPPGTGKTFAAAAIVAALLQDPDARVLCIAPLNVAVVKLCEEVARAAPDEPLLALFSGNGKVRYREQVEKISAHLLAQSIASPEFVNKLNEKEKKEVNRYLKDLESKPKVASEQKIAQIFLGFEKRRVIFATLAMAEQISSLIPETNVIILDEAGQASFAQTMGTIGSLPRVNKVLITGDKYQLSVNLRSLPEAVRNGFGMDTIILNLEESAANKTALTKSFRSHANIVECVSKAVYEPKGQILSPGPDQHLNLINFGINLPVKDCPIVVINDGQSPMVGDEVSFSSSNQGQTALTIRLLEGLAGFEGTIRVICLYSGQAAEIGQAIEGRNLGDIIVCTADSTQGHEAELAIVVTTWSGGVHVPSSKGEEPFWADEKRVNVAISRGRSGLLVIGDVCSLYKAPIWKRFFDKVMELSVICSTDYLANMKGEVEYRHGVLAAAQDMEFYAKLRSKAEGNGNANQQVFFPPNNNWPPLPRQLNRNQPNVRLPWPAPRSVPVRSFQGPRRVWSRGRGGFGRGSNRGGGGRSGN